MIQKMIKTNKVKNKVKNKINLKIKIKNQILILLKMTIKTFKGLEKYANMMKKLNKTLKEKAI
jgi:hypothetical protein